MENIRKLLEEVDVCIACKGLAPCRKMPGDRHGDPGSGVMVVNQFPDQRSFDTDRYWSNPSGEKLRGVFTDIGVDPERTCYLTDVLKCVPPGDRKPSTQEISNCRDFLKREVALRSQGFIVPVGDVAAREVFGILGLDYPGILRLHNENGVKEVQVGRVTIISVQHPSQAPRFMDFVLYRYHLKDLFRRLLEL